MHATLTGRLGCSDSYLRVVGAACRMLGCGSLVVDLRVRA